MGRVAELGDAEVDDFDHAVGGHDHVGGLDVSMDDAVRVRSRQALGDLPHDRDGPRQRDAAAVEQRLERVAVVVGESDERLAIVGVSHLVHDSDVGVIERRCRPSLLNQAIVQRSIRLDVGMHREKFQGDESSQRGVTGFVDHPHAAAAQLADDFVLPNRACHESLVRGPTRSSR